MSNATFPFRVYRSHSIVFAHTCCVCKKEFKGKGWRFDLDLFPRREEFLCLTCAPTYAKADELARKVRLE